MEGEMGNMVISTKSLSLLLILTYSCLITLVNENCWSFWLYLVNKWCWVLQFQLSDSLPLNFLHHRNGCTTKLNRHPYLMKGVHWMIMLNHLISIEENCW